MTASMTRRAALAGALLAAPALLVRRADAAGSLTGLEQQVRGRIGVAALNVETGRRLDNRSDERFPLCSTFKFLAAACVLRRTDQGVERLDRRIAFTEGQVVALSPVTERRTGGAGMTLRDLCEAAITASDNTAGNLLLDSFGGPPALTDFCRSIGDSATRLDRKEPELNDVAADDPRDSTTPAAMLEDLRKILLGDVLSKLSRDRLAAWLVASHTGRARLRAGLPGHWRVGDKTGTGLKGASADIAVAWPPGGGPILIAAYLTGALVPDGMRDAIYSQIGRMAAGL
ncbi:beta-lactamase class A [Tistlia consotensis]|uniref:Beta-lactamase n=1 Tax=Tistlia consotensis USBA 355 TaxID=560819 RepID=A0A1Y6CM52_9PROT|nr:class A beta-lactamase [Tistlia consotensis]SMF62889.1 beta-lactamase class A [Tistlia consotensis USBA 355]SNR95251.1 beta-lactamase class A [Tistlia consotensis]